MATRTSEGRFLEILEASAAEGIPIEFVVFDGASLSTAKAVIEGAFDGAYQEEMSEVGSGRFSVLRSDPKLSSIKKGDLVRVRVGGVDRGAWWVEEPLERLTSAAGPGREVYTARGRGALAYLERAIVYPTTWPIVAAHVVGVATGSNDPTATTSVSCSRPSGVANGDELIAAVVVDGTVAVNVPSGWVEVERVEEGSSLAVVVFRRTVGAGEPTSYSWTFPTATKAAVVIVGWGGISGDETTWSVASTSGSSGTAISHPSVGVGTAYGAAVTIAAVKTGSDVTPPSGYQEAGEAAFSGSVRVETAYVIDPALGETGDLVSTNTASGPWIGVSIFLPSSASNEVAFAGATFGGILATLIDRAKARGAIPAVVYTFDPEVDSHGQPWTTTYDLSFAVGTSLLDVWRHLVSLGLEGRMTSDLRLEAYVDMSRHLEDSVIFRKGWHLRGDVENVGHYASLRTRYLVEGAGGRIVEVVDPALEADPAIGRREGYLAMSTSDSPTDLSAAGNVSLQRAKLEDQARSVPVSHGSSDDGLYEPWVDYRVGDWVGIDANGDGSVSVERVVGITVSQRDPIDYDVVLDLNSVSLEAEIRLRRQIDALSRSSASGSVGSSGLGLGGGTGANATGQVAVTNGDVGGYLNDKVQAVFPIKKTIGGKPGDRVVAISIDPSVIPGADSTPPSTPTGLAATGGYRLIGAAWAPVPENDLAFYELRWYQGASPPPGDGDWTVARVDATIAIIGGLSPDLPYLVAVRAVDRSGNASAWSSSVSATPTKVGSGDLSVNAVVTQLLNDGTISADQVSGGSLSVGGLSGAVTQVAVYDGSGNLAGMWSDGGLVIYDTANTQRRIRLAGGAIQLSTDGGSTWNTVINADGVSIDGTVGEAFHLGAGDGTTLDLGTSGLVGGGVSRPVVYRADGPAWEGQTLMSPVSGTVRLTSGNAEIGQPTTAGQSGVLMRSTGSLELVANAGVPYLDFKIDALSDFAARIGLWTDDRLHIVGRDFTIDTGSLRLSYDVDLSRSAANVLRVGAGDRLDADAVGRIISRSTAISVPANTWTAVTGMTDVKVGLGTTRNAYGNGEIRVDVAGWYLIVGVGEFYQSTSGNRRIIACAFGSYAAPPTTPSPVDERTYVTAGANVAIHMQAVYIVYLAAGATIGLRVHQNSSGNLNLTTASLAVTRLGL